MKEAILVLTNKEDKSVDGVIEMLKEGGEWVFRFNVESFPRLHQTTMELSAGTIQNIVVSESGEVLSTQAIKSCWYRHAGTPGSDDGLTTQNQEFIKAESRAAFWSFCTTTKAFWMNHPLRGVKLLENNKLYQMMIAAEIGIKVPDTIVTNNPSQLLRFCEQHGGTIAAKLLSGRVFQVEGKKDIQAIYTQVITRDFIAKNKKGVRVAPIMGQEYVQKELELRITFVNGQIFPCAIYSQDCERTKHDWRRYDFKNVRHEPCKITGDLKKKITELMALFGLSYGAIDMIITPKGEYVFLEVNPSGQWGWIEYLTGLPISQAIASTLSHPPDTLQGL